MIVAHIVLEAKTPLKGGSSESSFYKDAPVQKDWNRLPMILGTSITGVIRSFFEEKEANYIFGYQKETESEGSKVIISNALLLDENGKVNEGLLLEKSKFLKYFENLPVREHTAIDHKGVAKKHSKFDEEVVFKGSRFKFAIEFLEDVDYKKVLDILYDKRFRLGGGSTKGFGEIEVIDITYEEFDNESYVNFVNSLNTQLKNRYKPVNNIKTTIYELRIKPDDFFIFGSGFGDEDADMTPVFEDVIDYEKKTVTKNKVLIPASSIKGAISHRVAFYYNKDKKIYADKLSDEEFENYDKDENEAINYIFGHKKEKKNNKEIGEKGKILFSDCFKEFNNNVKVFDYVKIDRFTQGAVEGALFQEKTIKEEDEYTIKMVVRKDLGDYEKYFENALKDIANGLLPLGGSTTKGHGFFSGKVFKNGVEI